MTALQLIYLQQLQDCENSPTHVYLQRKKNKFFLKQQLLFSPDGAFFSFLFPYLLLILGNFNKMSVIHLNLLEFNLTKNYSKQSGTPPLLSHLLEMHYVEEPPRPLPQPQLKNRPTQNCVQIKLLKKMDKTYAFD